MTRTYYIVMLSTPNGWVQAPETIPYTTKLYADFEMGSLRKDHPDFTYRVFRANEIE